MLILGFIAASNYRYKSVKWLFSLEFAKVQNQLQLLRPEQVAGILSKPQREKGLYIRL